MRNLAQAAAAASPTTETRSFRFDHGPGTAPPADTSYERREQLERDLDRVQSSLNSERTAFGQQLAWLMLSQALLLNGWLLLLLVGWSTPLPAKRWLLAGVAVFAAAVAMLIVFALRGTREAVIALSRQRKGLEAALQKDFGRPPLFEPRGMVTSGLASFANSLLPKAFVVGWLVLVVYSLAAPLGLPAPAVAVAAPTQLAADGALPAVPAAGGFRW